MTRQPVSPIPDGFHTVTPYLVVAGAAEAIAFYGKAFGAEEIMRMAMPDGRVMHGEIRIGDSQLMISDNLPEFGMPPRDPNTLKGTPVSLHLYVKDCDAAIERATKAGCELLVPAADMFWGDRFGKVKDPYGHEWSIATHQRDVSPEEMAEAAKQAMQGGGS